MKKIYALLCLIFERRALDQQRNHKEQSTLKTLTLYYNKYVYFDAATSSQKSFLTLLKRSKISKD